MLNIRLTDRMTVPGQPGSGKTTLVRYIAQLAMPNVYIYDTNDQYGEFGPEQRYVPRTGSMEEFEKACELMCNRTDCLFIVEEAHKYLREGRELGEYAFDVVNRGRNWGIGMIAVTTRVQRLSKDFFDLCRMVFFFRCGLRSRSYLREMVPDQVRVIQSLKPFHFLAYNLEEETGKVATLVLPPSEAAAPPAKTHPSRAHIEAVDKVEKDD